MRPSKWATQSCCSAQSCSYAPSYAATTPSCAHTDSHPALQSCTYGHGHTETYVQPHTQLYTQMQQ